MNNDKQEACGEIVVSGWHLKKEVTIAQVVTIICVSISLVVWAVSIEGRVDQIESHFTAEDLRIEQKNDIIVRAMNSRFDRYQADVKDALRDIKGGIDRVEDKLDKKADK